MERKRDRKKGYKQIEYMDVLQKVMDSKFMNAKLGQLLNVLEAADPLEKSNESKDNVIISKGNEEGVVGKRVRSLKHL